MEWNLESIRVLEVAIKDRWDSMVKERNTDRKNMSEIWNKYLASFGITLLRPKTAALPSNMSRTAWQVRAIKDAINFRNDDVSNALCVSNPDRPGQFMFVPRDMAEKFLFLGMP
jgi:hypothetical protein